MPRGLITKPDMLSRVYRLKNSVYNKSGKYAQYDEVQLKVVDETLNDILDILGEYSG